MLVFGTMRPEQDGGHFANNILKSICRFSLHFDETILTIQWVRWWYVIWWPLDLVIISTLTSRWIDWWTDIMEWLSYKDQGSNWWLSARLQYLHCWYTGDTVVLHRAIDIWQDHPQHMHPISVTVELSRDRQCGQTDGRTHGMTMTITFTQGD